MFVRIACANVLSDIFTAHPLKECHEARCTHEGMGASQCSNGSDPRYSPTNPLSSTTYLSHAQEKTERGNRKCKDDKREQWQHVHSFIHNNLANATREQWQHVHSFH